MDALSTLPYEVLIGAGIEAIYAGVDWISCTLPADAPGCGMWQLAALHAVKQVEKEGNRLEAFSRNGYDGWGAGGCFCGARHDGTYLQLSGHHAGELLDSVYRDDLHISRLDVQTTVRYRVYAPGVGRQLYKKTFDANGAVVPARRRKLWYIEGSDGGYTAYIGAASADQRGRMYNKAIQSSKPEYERCWRWEVMTRNDYATAWCRQIMAETRLRPQLCARIVATWYSLRGAPPEWAAFIPLIALPLIKEMPSDADRQLKWLREQVRPAVTRLLAAGLERQVIEALDLQLSGQALRTDVPSSEGGPSDA